jgi:phosphodiesterase/alkaline phosphatase D-like protein
MQVKRLLYIAALFCVLNPSALYAQNYADSTIVYLHWERDPLTTMVINWIGTPGPNTAKIEYRRRSTTTWTVAKADSNLIPDASVMRYWHEITGLLPGTNYEFRLQGQSRVQLFRTMPADLSGELNFIVTGDVYGDGEDPEFDSAAFQIISQYASAYFPFFAVLAGDLVHLNDANEYNASTLNRIFKFLSEWTKFMRTPNTFHIPIVTAYGNHELPQRFGGSPGDAVYFNALFSFPGLRGYERLDFAEYLSLIVLNTDHTARIEGAQTTWLENQLQQTLNFKNVFPVYHVSAYPGFRDPLPGRGLEVKDIWTPIFDRYNVSFAFEHDRHEYKRTVPITNDAPAQCGVRYIGGGGYAILTGGEDLGKWYIEKFSNQRHFVRVMLTNTKRSIQTIAFDGSELDYYEEASILAPPAILSSSSIGSSSFTVNWQLVCDAVNYRLDVSTDPNFNSFISGFDNRTTGNTNRFEVTGLNPLTRYFFRLRSVGVTGERSGYSASSSTTTTSPPPVAVTATQVSSSGFTANWNAVSGVTSYVIDISTNPAFSTFVGQYESFVTGNVTSLQITGLTSATPYYYRIRARNNTINQESGNSNVSGVITLPVEPQNFSVAQQTSSGFRLNWDASPRTNQYSIDVATDANFQNVVTGYSNFIVTTPQITVSGLNPLTTYYVRGRSRNLEYNVTSIYSNAFSLSTTGVPPLAIQPTVITRTSFVATWEASQSADAYTLDVSTDPLFENLLPGFADRNVGNALSFEVSGLLSGVRYYYRVRARSVSLNLSSEVSNVISIFTIPDTPVGLAPTEIETRSFQANWGSVPRITNFLLDVSTNPGFTTFATGWNDRLISQDTSIIVDNLSPNTRYYYRVRATSSDQSVTSGYSTVRNLYTLLEAPTQIEIDLIASSSFTVSWLESENADAYTIELATDPEFVTLVPEYENLDVGNTTQIVIDNLEPVTEYYFRVKATGIEGNVESPFSTTISFITLPKTPELFVASDIKAIGFTMSWSPVVRASYYELDVSYNDDFTLPYDGFVRRNVGDVTEIELTDALPGTRLFYRVRAVNTDLNVISEWSVTRDVTTIAIDPLQSTIELSKQEVLADGADFSEITVTVKDAQSNLLVDVSVSMMALNGTSVIETVQGRTNNSGSATFHVSNNRAEFVRYRVTAIQTVLTSTPEVSFTPVSPVARLATTVLASSFIANWDAVNGAQSYKVDVSTNAAFTNFLTGYQNVDVDEATSLEVAGLYPGDQYFYQVRAVAETGTSTNSNAIEVITQQADASLTSVSVDTTLVLANNTDLATISIQVRGTDNQLMSGVPVRLETDDIHSTTDIINGLTDQNGLAEFTVKSDFAGLVRYTVFAGRVEINTKAEINFVPLAPRASQPSILGAVEFKIGWTKVNGATNYVVDVARDPNFNMRLGSYNSLNVGDVDELLVVNLNPGNIYYFRVRAATATVNGDFSNTIAVTTYRIDLKNSSVVYPAAKILANGEQKSEVVIKLINENGDPLNNVRVSLIPNSTVYTIVANQELTDAEGIAKFSISSLVAGEGEFVVSAGGLELEKVVKIIFLFADGELKLGNNFPNPFGVTTKIPITIPERMQVSIDIYNSFGQRVAELENKQFLAGYYEIPFTPRGLSSGTYIVRMIADGKMLTQKMMLIK